MSSWLDQLLVPPRVAVRALDDFRRIADAAVTIASFSTELRAKLRPLDERFGHAVVTLDSIRDELGVLRAGFEPLSDDLDALRAAFAATTDELQRLRETFAPELAGVHAAADDLHLELRAQRELTGKLDSTLRDVGAQLDVRLAGLTDILKPIVRDLDEVREVVEPLQTATERVGRMAERLPGPGRKR